MSLPHFPNWLLLFATHLILLAPVWGQDVNPAPLTPSSTESSALDATELKARLARIEADPNLESAAKTEPAQAYRSAIQLLEQARQFEAQAAAYRDALATASPETQRLRAELEQLKAAPVTAPPSGNDASLEDRLSTQRASFNELKNQLAELNARLTDQETARAEQIQQEQKAARAQLAEPEPPAEAASDLLAEATGVLRQAKRRAAQSRLAMLEQEQLSFQPRLALLTAQRDVLVEKVAQAATQVEALETLANQQRQIKAQEVRVTAEQAQNDAAGKHPILQKLAGEVAELSTEYQRVTDRLAGLNRSLQEAEERNRNLTESQTSISKQLEIGAAQGAFSKILMDQHRGLPSPGAARAKLNAFKEEIANTRARSFAVSELLRSSAANAALKAETDAALLDPDLNASQRAVLAQETEAILAQRKEVLENLSAGYRTLVDGLVQLGAIEQTYYEGVQAFQRYLEEKLFWIASSPVVGMDTLQKVPAAVAEWASPERWKTLAHAFLEAVTAAPIRAVLVILIGAVCLFSRRPLTQKMEQLHKRVKKVSQDRWSYTFRAFAITAFLSLPVPLFVTWLGWELSHSGSGSISTFAVGTALEWLGFALFFTDVLLEIAKPAGLGERHFGWDRSRMADFRKNLRGLMLVYLPGWFILIVLVSEGVPAHLDSLGRLIFIGMMLWSAWILRQALHPQRGLLAGAIQRSPESWINRLRLYWYSGAICAPVLLAIMAVLGYLLSALALNSLLQQSVCWIAGTVILYSLSLRWFAIHERKLALQRALEERRARREEAEAEESDFGEVEEEESLDLATVGGQTRRLLRFLAAVGLGVGLWLTWSEAIPALQHLDSINVAGSLSLSGLLIGGVILLATIVAAKNIPGILEITILRNLPITPGSRSSVSTLVSYALVAIGLAMMFQVLKVDWSKFSWIVAALSVGLGFGLQEVVANFVCGIILLFERPIRVGDVVTVGGVSGQVSRIRIRATTITDWDRKEFIVPNKEFVTGTIMNWTLSSPIIRIVIPVGVAYGTDTSRVRAIMLEVASNHPDVMKDPAPKANLELFGDSTLNFSLRCFLPTPDKRLDIVHDLHCAIHQRFAEENIEIPFPQRDLHVRTVPKGWTPRDGQDATT